MEALHGLSLYPWRDQRELVSLVSSLVTLRLKAHAEGSLLLPPPKQQNSGTEIFSEKHLLIPCTPRLAPPTNPFSLTPPPLLPTRTAPRPHMLLRLPLSAPWKQGRPPSCTRWRFSCPGGRCACRESSTCVRLCGEMVINAGDASCCACQK